MKITRSDVIRDLHFRVHPETAHYHKMHHFLTHMIYAITVIVFYILFGLPSTYLKIDEDKCVMKNEHVIAIVAIIIIMIGLFFILQPSEQVQEEEPTTPGEEPTSKEPTTPGEEPTTPGEEPTTPDEEPTTPDEEPPPVAPPPGNCTDSDGGLETREEGVTSNDSFSERDVCISSSSVREFYCDNGKVVSLEMNCSADYECDNGECSLESDSSSPNGGPSAPACNDSDGGQESSIDGRVILGTSEYYDQCIDTTTVLEYYCEDNEVESVELSCLSNQVCVDARCDDKCIDTDNEDPTKKGITKKGKLSYPDNCASSTSVKEYDCFSPTRVIYTEVECQSDEFCDFEKGICTPKYCVDSDGGLIISSAGYATDAFATKYDECKDDTQVSEAYCNNDNEAVFTVLPCPIGTPCIEGECPSCYDSDGGLNEAEQGTVNHIGTLFTDFCTGNTLTEYYCIDTATYSSKSTPCDTNEECKDGACTPIIGGVGK
jgi:hypothetical protein